MEYLGLEKEIWPNYAQREFQPVTGFLLKLKEKGTRGDFLRQLSYDLT